LQARDRRLAFQGTRTSHAPDGFGQGEFPLSTDFPFEFGFRIRTLRFSIVVHAACASVLARVPRVEPVGNLTAPASL
jgi:hypothetical protein